MPATRSICAPRRQQSLIARAARDVCRSFQGPQHRCAISTIPRACTVSGSAKRPAGGRQCQAQAAVSRAARPCRSAVAAHAAPQPRTLFFMEKLMKLVSTSTWYGGPSCVLYLKNSAVGVFSLRGPGRRSPSPQPASTARH